MLVTVVNNTAQMVTIGGLQLSVSPSSTKTVQVVSPMALSTMTELDNLRRAGYISYTTSDDPAEPQEFEIAHEADIESVVYTVALEAVQPAANINTAIVRGRVTNPPVTSPVVMEFAVFNEAEGVNSSTNGTLSTETAGTILFGTGSAALKIKTDATGLFQCSLADVVDETVYIAAFSTAAGPLINCRPLSLGVVFHA